VTTTPRPPHQARQLRQLGRPSQSRLRRYAAGLAAAGLLSTPLLLASTGSAAAETPEQRCQRQTAEYNTAMDTAWRAAHPGQQPTGNEWPPFVCRDIPTPTPPPGGGNGGSQPAPERTHQYEGFDRPDSEYQQDMNLGGLGGPRTGLSERMGTAEPTDTTGPSASDTARSNVRDVVPWNTTITDDNGNTRDVQVVDTPDGPAVITDNGTATGEILTTDTATGVTSVTRQDGLQGRQLTDPTNNGRADGTDRDDAEDTSRAASTSAAIPAPGVDDTADEAAGGDGDNETGGLPVGPLGAGGALAGAAGAILADRRRRDGAHRGDINWGNGREQSLLLLEGPDSPREHRFDMDVPEGGQMVKNPDGSVDVLDADGNVVEHVKAPWAYDASGRPVETYYEVDNETGELVQIVDPDRTTLLPILADPDKSKLPGRPRPGTPPEGAVFTSPGVQTTYFAPYDVYPSVIEFDPTDESLWSPMTAGVGIAPDGTELAQPRNDATGYIVGGYNYQLRPVRARSFSSGMVDIDGREYKWVAWQYEYEVRYMRTDGVRDGDGGTALPVMHGWSEWRPLNDNLRDALLSNHLVELPTP
jgi:hypothetical protein